MKISKSNKIVFFTAISTLASWSSASGDGDGYNSTIPLRYGLTADAGKYSELYADSSPISLVPFAFIQFRYIFDSQDQHDSQNNLTLGFENSRTRIGLKGELRDSDISFYVGSGFTGSGSSLLLDVWMKWKPSEEFSLRIGQFKLPTWQEWSVSETKQTFVERSVLNARFAQLYSQGIEATWTHDNLRVIGAFSDGLRSWNDRNGGDQWAVSGRAEALMKGNWSQREDFQSFRDEEDFFIIGIAGHTQDGGTAMGAGGSNSYTNGTQIQQWTCDAQLGQDGVGLYAAAIWNCEESPAGIEYQQFGFLVQGQAFVTDDIELFARYEYGELDGEGRAFSTINPGATTNEKLSVLTVGLTKFVANHALKFTSDVGASLDEVSGAWRGSGRGWNGDDAGAGTQFVLRAQVQVLF